VKFYDPYKPCVRRLVRFEGGIWEVVARRDYNQARAEQFYRIEHRFGPCNAKSPQGDIGGRRLGQLTEMEVIAAAAAGFAP
jgi:hypothetical protein